MEYSPLNYTHYDLFAGVLLALCLGVLLMGIIVNVVLIVQHQKEKQQTAMRWFSGLTVLLLIASFATFILDEQTDYANQKVAEQNISQKYDVKDVLWQNSETTAYSNGHIKDGKLIVLTQENTEVPFIYTVNPQTHEPLLADIPATTNEHHISAESLVKKDEEK